MKKAFLLFALFVSAVLPAQETFVADAGKNHFTAAAPSAESFSSQETNRQAAVRLATSLARQMQYPSQTAGGAREGRVLARVVIGRDLTVKQATFLESSGAEFENAVRDALLALTPQTLSELGFGQATAVFLMPLRFQLR